MSILETAKSIFPPIVSILESTIDGAEIDFEVTELPDLITLKQLKSSMSSLLGISVRVSVYKFNENGSADIQTL